MHSVSTGSPNAEEEPETDVANIRKDVVEITDDNSFRKPIRICAQKVVETGILISCFLEYLRTKTHKII